MEVYAESYLVLSYVETLSLATLGKQMDDGWILKEMLCIPRAGCVCELLKVSTDFIQKLFNGNEEWQY